MTINLKKPASLSTFLTSLTFMAVFAQITFCIIHYKISDLLDSFVKSSIELDYFHSVTLLPLILFLLVQLALYICFIMTTWFLTQSICQLFSIREKFRNTLGFLIFCVNASLILILNGYYYPHSFFATLLPQNHFFLVILLIISGITGLLSLINLFYHSTYRRSGLVLSGIIVAFLMTEQLQIVSSRSHVVPTKNPNIIIIGLDSVRPDFTGFLGGTAFNTPSIDAFLKSATLFTKAYTPLARTFPSWMTILTGQYPKHSQARTNLADPSLTLGNDTLAKHLQTEGYETIYATDEKRFSNITEGYGFDRIMGPSMGINDFILGSLNDFPLSNLFINTGLGRLLFPYNYANRAAAITYQPDRFLELVKLGLADRTNKPLFLAIHLCVSHWPYTWANDGLPKDALLPDRYQRSVEAVDKQLGQLLSLLEKNGLLRNTLVVLLSDHGTTVGLSHDRIVATDTYQGDHQKLSSLNVFKLSHAEDFSFNFKKDYSISTSYGQGTDILSLKQYHVLLAMKGFGLSTPTAQIHSRVSLLDIAPTILDFLHYPALKKIDGISLASAIKNPHTKLPERPFFLETGYSLSDIESKNIITEQVVKKAIGLYKINPRTGQLFVNPVTDKAVNANKQRAILFKDWLLARYPAEERQKLVSKPLSVNGNQNTGSLGSSTLTMAFESFVQPPYYVIANLKTGQWSIGLDSELARSAPVEELTQQLNTFYQGEMY